jgi:hypothetical protein
LDLLVPGKVPGQPGFVRPLCSVQLPGTVEAGHVSIVILVLQCDVHIAADSFHIYSHNVIR